MMQNLITPNQFYVIFLSKKNNTKDGSHDNDRPICSRLFVCAYVELLQMISVSSQIQIISADYWRQQEKEQSQNQ